MLPAEPHLFSLAKGSEKGGGEGGYVAPPIEAGGGGSPPHGSARPQSSRPHSSKPREPYNAGGMAPRPPAGPPT
eukprot:2285596-Prymnesium_polylepis.1